MHRRASWARAERLKARFRGWSWTSTTSRKSTTITGITSAIGPAREIAGVLRAANPAVRHLRPLRGDEFIVVLSGCMPRGRAEARRAADGDRRGWCSGTPREALQLGSASALRCSRTTATLRDAARHGDSRMYRDKIDRSATRPQDSPTPPARADAAILDAELERAASGVL